MARSNPTLLSNSSSATGSTRYWKPTGGRIYSVDAVIDDSATAAMVNVYGSNSNAGTGVLIGTITLSSTTRNDGLTFSDDDGGWFFVSAELASISGGSLKNATACVAKE